MLGAEWAKGPSPVLRGRGRQLYSLLTNSYSPMSTLGIENRSELQIKNEPKKDFRQLKKPIVMLMLDGSLKSGTRKLFAQMLTLWSKKYAEIYKLNQEAKGSFPEVIMKKRAEMKPIFEEMKVEAKQKINSYLQ